MTPDWDVFGAVGCEAQIIVGVRTAQAILVLLGSAVVGAVLIRVAHQRHNTTETKKGQSVVAGSLLGLIATTSMATLFTIVHGSGIQCQEPEADRYAEPDSAGG